MICFAGSRRRNQRGTAQRNACRIPGLSPDSMESGLSPFCRGLRRRAKAHAFRVLAGLIAVLLPLQGISGAMAAIHAPAHYHVRVVTAAAGPALAHVHAPPAIEAKRVASYARGAGHSHEASPDQGGIASSLAPVAGPHSHPASSHADEAPAHLHHASLTAKVPPPTPAAHADDGNGGVRHVDAGTRRQSTLIGHHAHALVDAGVVYVQGDPDRPDSSSTGKHAAAADAALTGWWMPMRGAMGAQSLPHAHWRYQSHPGLPALRPPAASGVLTA